MLFWSFQYKQDIDYQKLFAIQWLYDSILKMYLEEAISFVTWAALPLIVSFVSSKYSKIENTPYIYNVINI